jgi:hypothetical protein
VRNPTFGLFVFGAFGLFVLGVFGIFADGTFGFFVDGVFGLLVDGVASCLERLRSAVDSSAWVCAINAKVITITNASKRFMAPFFNGKNTIVSDRCRYLFDSKTMLICDELQKFYF